VALGEASRAVVIVGGVAESGAHAATIRNAAQAFAGNNHAALCRIPQGANALGLSRLGLLPASRDAGAMLREARGAYVVYGIEPGLDFADQALAMQALGDAQVVAFSHFACESTRKVADVILPIGLLPEVDATLVNLEGREQRAVAGGKLPGEARAGWRVLRALGGALDAPGFEFTELAQLRDGVAQRNWDGAGAAPVPGAGEGGLEVAATQAIYRVDAVLRRAAALQAHPLTTGARISLAPADASAAGLADGAMAKVATARGNATLPVVVDDRVASGCAWIESGYGATAPLLASGKLEVTRA